MQTANAIANAAAELGVWAHTVLGAAVTLENPSGSSLWPFLDKEMDTTGHHDLEFHPMPVGSAV